MAMPKIQVTKNYRMFERIEENRSLDLKKHKKLRESMVKYGFLKSFPLSCLKNGNAKLIVKDGQHRLAIAESLGLPVVCVVDDIDFDVAEVNSTPKVWTLRDYAMKFAANGSEHYIEGLAFAETHGLSLGIAFGLLAGTVSWGNVKDTFYSGDFVTKDREWADKVASTYSATVNLSSHVKNTRFVEACMAACRVEDFDSSRFISGAERCRDNLVSYSTRDAYLAMMEDVYNYGRKTLLPLKVNAMQAMKDRSAVPKKESE